MPIYEYRPCDGECYLCNGNLRLFQSIHAEAHTTCPYCRQPVERIISVPQGHVLSRKDILKDSHIKATGYAKYVRSDQGTYELAVGPDDAPKNFNRPPDIDTGE